MRTDGHIVLAIRDDGKGFDPVKAGAPAAGMGLRLMAYRARLVGTQFEVASRIGEGTTVTCVYKTL